MFIQEPESNQSIPPAHTGSTGIDPDRIQRPAARVQFRSRPTFHRQAWWGISLGAVVLLYLGIALLFQQEYNANTTTVFNEVTDQARMPWYHQHPWFGALIFAALPGFAFAWVFVNLMETRFMAREMSRDITDLTLTLQHTGYHLQSQLDQIASRLDNQS